MRWIKSVARTILREANPDWEYTAVEQFRFNRLKRRPPELIWKAIAPGPEARLDAGGIRVGHELFIFGGMRWGGKGISLVDIFDLQKEKWTQRCPMPPNVAQTHQGMISDGNRYIFIISGQLGNNCSPPSAQCFVFDTLQKQWQDFLPLPKARYAPTVQLWNGRLHAVGGSQEDRNTPALDHWSIAVKEGQAMEKEWRVEPPITRGGPHRASAVIDGNFYVFGGQEGDYVAVPGDPEFRCTWELTCDHVYPDTYMLAAGAKYWKRMADMPTQASHTEFTVIPLEHSIAIMGGEYDENPDTKIMTITDVIQVYDAVQDSWKVVGRLPYRVKEMVATYFNGYLYITGGQRDKGPDDATPTNRFEKGVWKARVHF